MTLSEYGEEFLDLGIDLYKDNVEEIKKEFQKNKALRDWFVIMDAIEDLGYYSHSMTDYCIESSPPKKPVCKKQGNIFICEPQKPKLGYEEYTFSNVDPESFKECMEYWKFPVSKHRADLINTLKRKTI